MRSGFFLWKDPPTGGPRRVSRDSMSVVGSRISEPQRFQKKDFAPAGVSIFSKFKFSAFIMIYVAKCKVGARTRACVVKWSHLPAKRRARMENCYAGPSKNCYLEHAYGTLLKRLLANS